jgi:hypothetical protein
VSPAGGRRRLAGLSTVDFAGLRLAGMRLVLISRDVLAMRVFIAAIFTL